MKKVYIYALACALSVISCQDNEWVADNATSQAVSYTHLTLPTT